MKQRRRHETRKERSARLARPKQQRDEQIGLTSTSNPYLTIVGVAAVAACTAIIYGQTVKVPTINYEDSFYLVRNAYVHVTPAFSRLQAVWNQPYFANFHPVTTTTWVLDRALGDPAKALDSLPFRVTHLLYAVIGASLLMPLYRRLGVPAMLGLFGALVYAAHPIHTEVVAWLSARKDLISLIFILMSFLAWLWARCANTPNQWRVRYSLAIMFGLLAVLSKPVAVILPCLVVAYEFCSGPHAGIFGGGWAQKIQDPLLRRTLSLTAIFLVIGGSSTAIFQVLLARDPMQGGWPILVPVVLLMCTLPIAPAGYELAAFREQRDAGIRVIGPPLVVLSVVFGAGSAWTFWAQQQVGAIKGGASLMATLNLTSEAMLSYAGKAILPLKMSVSYTWSQFPNVSAKGILGAAMVCGIVWIATQLAGSVDRHRRLIAFGLFWFLIALLPISNLVPTSTKMADRYLFVPTVGSILAFLGLMAGAYSSSRRSRLALSSILALVVAVYTVWSYRRAEVWCGKTTAWQGVPNPDLSLWTAAVEADPDDTHALTNLGISYLGLAQPDAEKALENLNRALQLSVSNQSRMTGDKRIDLSPLYESLGDAHFSQASELPSDTIGSEAWQRKRAAYSEAIKFYRSALQNPSGFASDDARVFSRLAQSDEGLAQLDAQELATAARGQASVARERDELRHESERSMEKARQLLTDGNVPAIDANYQAVILAMGDTIFGREVGASDDERAIYYEQALSRYREAATLLPNDPRPLLYQGLCHERLTALAKSQEAKRREFALAEEALRRAIALPLDSPDYTQALPYRELAVLYTHVNDYSSALDALHHAQKANPASTEVPALERDIKSLEEYLAAQHARK